MGIVGTLAGGIGKLEIRDHSSTVARKSRLTGGRGTHPYCNRPRFRSQPNASGWESRPSTGGCWSVAVFLVVVLTVPTVTGSEPPGQANRYASDAARATLAFLANRASAGNGVLLIGQNIGHAGPDIETGCKEMFRSLAGVAGDEPALMGVDYGWNEIPTDLHPTNKLLIEHWNRGGLVTISMHPPNPWTGGGVKDKRVGNIADLMSAETPAGKRWLQTLDRVAAGLDELQRAGVVVLWRPLHEVNGDWFWWSCGPGNRHIWTIEFSRFWRHMFKYLGEQKGLHNLLWVYAPNATHIRDGQSVAAYYPGNAYVDVVGLDYYADNPGRGDAYRDYHRLAAIGKPFGFTEFGPRLRRDGTVDCSRLVSEIRSRYPQASFILSWHSWRGAKVGLVDQRNVAELFLDKRAVSLSRMPKRHFASQPLSSREPLQSDGLLGRIPDPLPDGSTP